MKTFFKMQAGFYIGRISSYLVSLVFCQTTLIAALELKMSYSFVVTLIQVSVTRHNFTELRPRPYCEQSTTAK